MRCRGRTRLTDDWTSADRTDMWKRYCRLDFVQTLSLDSDVRASMFALAWSRGCPSWKAAFCCTVAEN